MPAPPKDVLSVRARDDQVVSHVNKFVGWANTSPLALPPAVVIGTATPPATLGSPGSGSVSLESPGQYAFVSSKSGSHLAGNAYWDGTNWLRYDTAQPAAVWIANQGGLTYLSAGPGSEPSIPFATKLTLDINGKLTLPYASNTQGSPTLQIGNGAFINGLTSGGVSTPLLVVTGDNWNSIYCGPSGLLFTNAANTARIATMDNVGNLNLLNAGGGTLSANGVNSKDWFRLSAADVGIYNNINGVGIWFVNGGQLMYGGATHGDQIVGLNTVQTLNNKTIINLKMTGPVAFNAYGNDLTNYSMNHYNSTITLPPASAAYSGIFRGIKAWGADITVNCATACLIPPGTPAVVSAFGLRNGDSLTMWCDGSNWWAL